MNLINCSECHNKTHYKCSLLPSYQLYNFVKRKRKYACANCTPGDVSCITPASVDIEINELKDNLNKIEGNKYFPAGRKPKTQERKYNN